MAHFYFVTPNTFLTIPIVGEIYKYFKEKNETFVFQSSIRDHHNFFVESKGYKKIIEYPNYREYHRQSNKQKILKTIKFIILYVKNKPVLKNREIQRIIYCHELFPLFVVLIFKSKNEKIVYHQFEVLSVKKNTLDTLSYWYVKKKIDNIDLLLFPEENRAEYFKRQLKVKTNINSFILPNSNNNLPEFNRLDKTTRNKKIICTHIGAVGSNHHIATFLNAISTLDERKFEFRFIGRLSDDVKKLIREFKLSSVKTFGQVKHNELEKYYLETDIGIILYRDVGINYRYCAPNKLYEYWSFGIPVLGDILPGLISVFKNKSLGQLIDMSKSENIAEAIESFNCEQYKKSYIKNYFVENFKLDSYLNALEKKLNEK